VSGLSTPVVIGLFAVAAAATWAAGMALSSTTDELDHRFGLGDAVGGLVLLAIAGTLPEIAITVAAASAGNLGLAAGNLIGGIAVQTMVLVACDLAVTGDEPLTYLVGSLVPVLEGLMVVVVVGEVLLGALLPASDAIGPVSPASVAIAATWLGLLVVVDRTQRTPRWELAMPGSRPGRPHRRVRGRRHPKPHHARSSAVVVAMFAAACAVTLAGGVVLESGGDVLAGRAGINGVVFGATVLAAATALPELSSGIAAVRIGDNRLAAGDIFGGNAFQVCLFLLADLVAGRPVLPAAGLLNGWLGALGIVLTAIYLIGMLVRPEGRRLRLGPDSMLVVVGFALGVAGLSTLPG
jgi:cation:H+ antiporter